MVQLAVLSLCTLCIVVGSPGEQVGTTYFDFQANGNMGQRIAVDDSNQVYVVWMYCGGEYPGNPRFIRYNFRYPDGTWYGQTDASPSVSGYVQLDIMRGDSGLAKRPVLAYHGGAYAGSVIDIGLGNTSSPNVSNHIWPYVACANNNNIILATGNSSGGADSHHLYLTTDEGATWQHFADFDSCTCLSQFVRASHNPGSQKVVHVWTQSIAMDFPGLLLSQMACDVWYMLSTDNGVTWGAPVNITNFTPPGQIVNGDSTPWAYADVNAVFDNDDKLHIAWGANLGYKLNDTLYYADHAKILHWDEMTDDLHVISSPSWHYGDPEGWWLDVSAGFRQHTEAWRLPACGAQLVCDQSTGDLYCLWSGTADTTDYSAGGYFNSEIYGSRSTDEGISWSDYVNLTNTPSPGAGSGDCFDEDYLTVWPYVHNDSIFLTYIEDKDAGAAIIDGTAWIDNPVRVWIFHKNLITGIEEEEALRPDHAFAVLEISPNPCRQITDIRYAIWDEKAKENDTALKIYDTSGRLVRDFSLPTAYSLVPTAISWNGTDQSGHRLPAGVYFVELTAGDRTLTEKIVKLR
jgi:hypothetical protein